MQRSVRSRSSQRGSGVSRSVHRRGRAGAEDGPVAPGRVLRASRSISVAIASSGGGRPGPWTPVAAGDGLGPTSENPAGAQIHVGLLVLQRLTVDIVRPAGGQIPSAEAVSAYGRVGGMRGRRAHRWSRRVFDILERNTLHFVRLVQDKSSASTCLREMRYRTRRNGKCVTAFNGRMPSEAPSESSARRGCRRRP